MRRINPFALAVLVAAASVSAAAQLPTVSKEQRPDSAERLTKAQKKRERKARTRANIAAKL